MGALGYLEAATEIFLRGEICSGVKVSEAHKPRQAGGGARAGGEGEVKGGGGGEGSDGGVGEVGGRS